MRNLSKLNAEETTASADAATTDACPVTPAAGRSVIYVGFVGNIRELLISDGEAHTVKSVLAAQEINPAGYQIRLDGVPAGLDSPVAVGQTIMLLRPIRGNNSMESDKTEIASEATGETEAGAFFVTVGFVGNMQERMFAPGVYTAGDVLKLSEINSAGYDIRIDGQPGSSDTVLRSGQTLMLLRPIRGNEAERV
jgi:hypothetical protein